MKKTLVWRFDDEVDRMSMQAIRLVVRTASMRDYGEFQRLTRLATELWEQKFPLPDGVMVDDGEAGGEEAVEKSRLTRAEGSGVYLDVYRRWARLAAATAVVDVLVGAGGAGGGETRAKGKKAAHAVAHTVAHTVTHAVTHAVAHTVTHTVEVDWDAPQDGWPWSSSSLSALGWDAPDAVMDLPTDFFFAWEQAVLDVNPGVWGAARTSDAPNAKKKMGLVALF